MKDLQDLPRFQTVGVFVQGHLSVRFGHRKAVLKQGFSGMEKVFGWREGSLAFGKGLFPEGGVNYIPDPHESALIERRRARAKHHSQDKAGALHSIFSVAF